MANSCPICVKLVLDSEEGVGCDGACGRWFHRECLKMPKTEYQRLCGNNNEKWLCMRTDCVAPANQPLSLISAQMGSVISKLDTLLTKVKKIDGISEDIVGIKSQITEINAKFASLEPRITNVEDKVIAVEREVAEIRDLVDSNVSKLATLECGPISNNAGMEEVVQEMNERSLRSRNVMVFGLPESNKAEGKLDDDKKTLQKLFSSLEAEFDVSLYKCFRVGKLKKDKPRPVKIILDSESHAVKLIRESTRIQLNDISADLSHVRLSRDRTRRQMAYLDELNAELASRQKDGNTDLTIKFVNGIPKIVQKNL